MNSMKKSIIQVDAFLSKSVVGSLFVDMNDEGKVTEVYFQNEADKVYRLHKDRPIKLINDDEGVVYSDIVASDVFTMISPYGSPVYAGMKAVFPQGVLEKLDEQVEEDEGGQGEMSRFKFELAVDLEGNEHTGRLLITDNITGENLESAEIEAESNEDLLKTARRVKERFLLNVEVLEC